MALKGRKLCRAYLRHLEEREDFPANLRDLGSARSCGPIGEYQGQSTSSQALLIALLALQLIPTIPCHPTLENLTLLLLVKEKSPPCPRQSDADHKASAGGRGRIGAI